MSLKIPPPTADKTAQNIIKNALVTPELIAIWAPT